MKGVTAMSPGSCTFPCIVGSLQSAVCPLWMLQLSSLCCKSPSLSSSSLTSSELSLRAIRQAMPHVQVLSSAHQIRHGSLHFGCIFFPVDRPLEHCWEPIVIIVLLSSHPSTFAWRPRSDTFLTLKPNRNKTKQRSACQPRWRRCRKRCAPGESEKTSRGSPTLGFFISARVL